MEEQGRMNVTKQQWDHAYLSGQRARQAGRPVTACPRYGMGEDGQTLRARWLEGWGDEDAVRVPAARVGK